MMGEADKSATEVLVERKMKDRETRDLAWEEDE